jgi:RNA polymerase sigma factor (TIGR02999 family)
MKKTTELIQAVEAGQVPASELLPLVYAELRVLASQLLAKERPGQTLQSTALVHEGFLKLGGNSKLWNGPRHFFGAAANAIRQVLVDNAKRKRALKRGGGFVRQSREDHPGDLPEPKEDQVALGAALEELKKVDPDGAEVVQLQYYSNLTYEEVALVLDISVSTAQRRWTAARNWLKQKMKGLGENS